MGRADSGLLRLESNSSVGEERCEASWIASLFLRRALGSSSCFYKTLVVIIDDSKEGFPCPNFTSCSYPLLLLLGGVLPPSSSVSSAPDTSKLLPPFLISLSTSNSGTARLPSLAFALKSLSSLALCVYFSLRSYS